jgi:hypothetical protein
MTMGKAKFLSAVVVAAALLATVAVARTVQTHVAANVIHRGETIGAAPHTAPFVRHNDFACGLANESDCEKIEMLLPK